MNYNDLLISLNPYLFFPCQILIIPQVVFFFISIQKSLDITVSESKVKKENSVTTDICCNYFVNQSQSLKKCFKTYP